MPSGVVLHYQQCLLMWFLTIDHACQYRQCLLVNCHCNQHFTSRVQMEEGWLQVWCYSYRGAITSDMSADPVPFSDMHACSMQLYRICMLGSIIQIHMFVKFHPIRQVIWFATNPSDMPTGRVQLPQVCKTCRLPSWTPS